MPRKITITAKCEILSNSSDEKSLFTLYGENLKKSEFFTYLGVTFNTNGIDSLGKVEIKTRQIHGHDKRLWLQQLWF